MKNYIFLTTEGYTFQPNSESIDPDIDNLQVIGFAKGENSKKAFQSLLRENNYLKNTTFDEMFSYELSKDFLKTKNYFSLNNYSR